MPKVECSRCTLVKAVQRGLTPVKQTHVTKSINLQTAFLLTIVGGFRGENSKLLLTREEHRQTHAPLTHKCQNSLRSRHQVFSQAGKVLLYAFQDMPHGHHRRPF